MGKVEGVTGLSAVVGIKSRVAATTWLAARVNLTWLVEGIIATTAVPAASILVLPANQTYLRTVKCLAMGIGGIVPATETGIISIVTGGTLGLQTNERARSGNCLRTRESILFCIQLILVVQVFKWLLLEMSR